tara:strand:+ start:276 stop:626 length:351 start_codon:yes stop_codon:yes gene_type:complete
MTVKVKTKISSQSIFVEGIKRRIGEDSIKVNGKQVSFTLPQKVGDQQLPGWGRTATMDFTTGELSHDEDYSKDIIPFVDQMYRAEQVIDAADAMGLIYEESINDKGEIVLEVEHNG